MEIQKLNCVSCGAPLDIPDNSDSINCPFCHAKLVIKRDEGSATVKIIEQVSQAVQQTGTATQSAIQDGTQVTKSELKRLEISQDLSMLQLQLTNIQSEIRSLQRGRIDKVISNQIIELRNQENSLIQRIKVLQTGLMPSTSLSEMPEIQRENLPQKERKPISGWIPFLVGSPLLICGILLFLLFVISQLTNKAGVTDNLTGFFGALIICVCPFIIFGIILIIVGIFMIRKSKKDSEKKDKGK